MTPFFSEPTSAPGPLISKKGMGAGGTLGGTLLPCQFRAGSFFSWLAVSTFSTRAAVRGSRKYVGVRGYGMIVKPGSLGVLVIATTGYEMTE